MFLHILACSLIIDNSYLLMGMFNTLYHAFRLRFLIWILPYFSYPFNNVFYTSNVLITILMSYERYALISDDPEYQNNMKIAKFRYHRLRKYILGVSLFAIGFNSPLFFTHSLKECDINTSTFRWDIERTSFYEKIKTFDKGPKWSIFLTVAFVLLVFFNWKLFKHVKEKLQMTMELKSTNGKFENIFAALKLMRKKEKFTLVLFGLAILFFCCNIWYLIEVILKTLTIKPNWQRKYEIASRLMRLMNSCTNVFIYGMVNPSFRKPFRNCLRSMQNIVTCSLTSRSEQQDVTEINTFTSPVPTLGQTNIQLMQTRTTKV